MRINRCEIDKKGLIELIEKREDENNKELITAIVAAAEALKCLNRAIKDMGVISCDGDDGIHLRHDDFKYADNGYTKVERNNPEQLDISYTIDGVKCFSLVTKDEAESHGLSWDELVGKADRTYHGEDENNDGK